MQEEDRVRQIIKWRESLSKLPDHHFFELMRMYLGEIKTPYNKQNLIERLSTFLRLPQVRENTVRLLGENDVLLIAAVRTLPVPSLERITLFFKDTFTPRQVRDQLFNLEERLILFRNTEPDGKIVFSINPLLYDSLEELTGSAILFFSAEQPQSSDSPADLLTPLFLAAWFSFISCESDLCKTDGTFKKRAEALLETVFPHLTGKKGLYFASSLTTAFKNLLLIRQQDTDLKIDYERWVRFANLDERAQIIYITAASCGRFTRAALSKLSQFISDLCTSFSAGCTSRNLYRRAFLLQEQECGTLKKSRVTSIMQRRLTAPPPAEEIRLSAQNSEPDIQEIIEKMLLFGLLHEKNGVFTVARRIQAERDSGVVRIDAGFTVTILPELPLVKLLPLVRFLRVTRFDTAALFEITKNSCVRAFGLGILPAEMAKLLEEETGSPVAQNLLFSIEEWYSGYSSVRLYKGYVLHISDEKKHLVEESSLFEKYLVKKIADGFYLLDFTSDEEAAEFFKKSGLPFSGALNSVHRHQEYSLFLPLRYEDEPLIEYADCAVQGNFSQGSVLLRSLTTELEKASFTPEETDSLQSRINRRIILLPEQLRADSVRFEKIEASGMDFLGKMQVIEQACVIDSFIEIAYEEIVNGKKTEKVITGIPFSLEKQAGDAVVKIKTEPDERIESLPVGKALRVRRIRGSIFKDGI